MALKTVWNVKEGRWVNVPEHWIGHPVFGADLASEKPGVENPRPTKKEN